ncbi:helix-turn-helix domain-containing protein [Actinomadura sp. 6N118]|uniref:helix-turn-helix domain-containing protein n=1 Tax=Actinomadura sp. 6N118 TaxID=3375151 RepID=UPI0037BD1C7B
MSAPRTSQPSIAGRVASTISPTRCRRCSSTCWLCSPRSRPTSSNENSRGRGHRTRNGKLKGKPPQLTTRQQAELVRTHATGTHTIGDLMEVFSIGRATVYRVLKRAAKTP